MKTITIKKKHIKRALAAIFTIIVIFVVVSIALNAGKKSDQVATDTGLYLEPQSDPSIFEKIKSAPRASEVLGAKQEEPKEETKLYSFPAKGFSFEVPVSWTIQEVGSEVIVKSLDHQYSLQSYQVNINDAGALKKYLSNLSNLSDVADATISGHPGFGFNVTGIYEHGYAFLNNGKLFYLLGKGLEDSKIAEKFKTL
jgi:hypothetical protein